MEIKKQSSKINYIYNATYSVLTVLIPLITTPYIARVLGADGMGINTYNLVIATYFANFALLGVNFYGSRCISKYRDDISKLTSVFSEIYTMQILLTIIFTIAYFGYAFLIAKDNKLIVIIMSIYVITTGVSVSWFYSGIEYFKVTVTRNIVVKIITLCCIFIFVHYKEDLWKYVFISALGAFFGELYLLIDLRKFVKYKPAPLSKIPQHLSPNIKLFIPIIAVSIYRSMDKVMLKLLSDYEQVGFYGNSERIIEICSMLLSSLGQTMLPRITNLISKNDYSQVKKLIGKSFEIITCMANAMLFGLIAVADCFIPLFLGEGYSACISLLQLLAINLLFLGWGSVIKAEYLIPKERDSIYIIACLSGAIINLILNFIFIPRWLANGAVLATICAEITSLVVFACILKNELSLIKYIIENLWYVLFGALMYFVLFITAKLDMGSNLLYLLFRVVLGASTYCLCVLLYWKITGNEWMNELNRILGKIKLKNNSHKED